MAIEREMSFGDYLNVFRRRLPYALVFFGLAFLATIAVALKLSPVYQSTGKILIESQQIQSDTARQKYAVERFEVLKQLALSKSNLEPIAKKYNLYEFDMMPKSRKAQADKILKSGLTIDLLRADSGDWGEKATFAFQVSFNYYKPQETYDVTKDVINLFLSENERANKERVIDTAEFYSKEAEKQRLALQKIEKELTLYRQQHANSLPENKAVQLSGLERLEADLRATQRERSQTQAEIRSLDVSLESARAGIGLTPTQIPATNSNAELEQLKLELDQQSAIYSENHPSIRALKRRIESLERNIQPSKESGKSVTQQTVMVAKVQAQIDAANARLKLLDAEESSIRSKMNRTESLVIQSTQTEGVLGALLRDYDNAKNAYAEVKAKQENSKVAERIELDKKGERFVLVESPFLPEKPIKPNRKLIIFGGLLASLVGAIGFALLLEALDKRLRGANVLASAMRLQPIAVIPYITNKAEIKRKKYALYRILLSLITGVFLILLLLHLFLMPLDELVSKIVSKF